MYELIDAFSNDSFKIFSILPLIFLNACNGESPPFLKVLSITILEGGGAKSYFFQLFSIVVCHKKSYHDFFYSKIVFKNEQ